MVKTVVIILTKGSRMRVNIVKAMRVSTENNEEDIQHVTILKRRRKQQKGYTTFCQRVIGERSKHS